MKQGSIFPILLLISSLALFFTFTDKKYKEAKVVKAEVASYDNALDNSKELQKIRDQLLLRYNNILDSDRKRLELLLPDNIDNIRLILDIDTIASRYGIVIKDLRFSPPPNDSESFDPVVPKIKSLDFSFSVSSDYITFLTFVRDLESSLRIMDIVQINFAGQESASQSFTNRTLTIRTYWLP